MLTLPNVTLVAVDTACHDLTALAVKACTDKADFEEVLVLSDKDFIPGARHHQIDARNSEEATRAYWYILPPLLRTEFFMVIHWDSWIVRPEKWRRDFTEYDYIGAPWWYADDDRNVGNGGFSIRSTRLAYHLMESTLPFSHPEDDAICRKYRPILETKGFTWAPTNIASFFAFERVVYHPLKHIFGFHGMFNWPFVLTEDEIEERVALASPYVLEHEHYKQMREIQKKMRGCVV